MQTLLDFIYDNPGCHWLPLLSVTQASAATDELNSLENLQKQLQQLQLHGGSPLKVDVQETEEESKVTMSDFQLAETDLMDCLMRTNILQRI